MCLRPLLRAYAWPRLPVQVSVTVIAAFALGACAQTDQSLNLAASSGQEVAKAGKKPSPKEIQSGLTYWATAFAQSPASEKSSISYAKNLRYIGEKKKA